MTEYMVNGKVVEFQDAIRELSEENTELVIKKNKAYGNSVFTSTKILELLYPEGVHPDAYQNMLMIVRVIDKLMRIATDKDAFGESPWFDIQGYAKLALLANLEIEDES